MNEVEIKVNKKLSVFVKSPKRYKIAYGGRGGGKSWGIARLLLALAMQKPTRILCAREVQNSIKDSVWKLLRDQIDELGLLGFEVLQDTIRHANGSEFIFKGLYRNAHTIKSLEGVNICWIEEAEAISAESWRMLDPTIRAAGSQIWISFNPRHEDDVIYHQFVKNSDENAEVVKIGWQDNPYFGEALNIQRLSMLKNDPAMYAHIWEGEIKSNSAEQVFSNKWVAVEFDTPKNTHFYYGADWGFANDPNTLIRCFIANSIEYGARCLFIDYEACDRSYKDGGNSVGIDELPALWSDNVPRVRDYFVTCDSARPETIAYMSARGFKVRSAKKGRDSIEHGVEFIRGFDKVIIHPRCENAIIEFSKYSYKVDKYSGEITRQIVDKYNHLIDALRYALESAMVYESEAEPVDTQDWGGDGW